MSRQIHPAVYDVMDVFTSVTSDPIFGWSGTIVGTYDTIREMVLATTGNDYVGQEINQAMTWLHKYGAEEFGATISKAGPGGRTFEVGGVEYRGNIYILVAANERLTEAKWEEVKYGLLSWANYNLATATNDQAMGELYESLLDPNMSSTDARRVRRLMGQIQTFRAAQQSSVEQLRGLLNGD